MKKSKAWIVVSLLILLALLLIPLSGCTKEVTPASSAPSATVTDARTFGIAAGKTYTFFVRSEPKDPLEASFTIMGGEDDIDFYVKDPLGNLVVEKKRATDAGAFALFSNATGYHQVIFDNTFSTSANKLIWLKINHAGRGGIVP